MTDFFGHAENPLTSDEWVRINDAVIQVARRKLVGRRVIDVYGPLGAGFQAVAYDEFTGDQPANVDVVGEEPTAVVFTDNRQFRMIPIIYKDFLLHWRDLESARRLTHPLDTSAAAGAASFLADKEDEMIFHGLPKYGYEGLMTAKGRKQVPLRDWSEPGEAFQNVVEAAEALFEGGHYGPYALVASPRLYALIHRVFLKTGILEVDNIRKLVGEGVFQTNALTGNCAVLLSTGHENLDLAVALDMSVAYLGAQHMNHPFRVLESLILRIKHADAICTIETKGKK